MSAKGYEPKMTKEEYDQMAREIIRASESLWEGKELEEAFESIQLELLWPILLKHLNPTKVAIEQPDYLPVIQTPWDFVERYYPNYSSSDEIAHEGDLDKLVNKEYEKGDCAHELLMDEYSGNIEDPQIKADHDAVIRSIYESAILAYIEQIKTNR
jgi:hypothetical protein